MEARKGEVLSVMKQEVLLFYEEGKEIQDVKVGSRLRFKGTP